jgi:TolA-binding protein
MEANKEAAFLLYQKALEHFKEKNYETTLRCLLKSVKLYPVGTSLY